MHLSAYSRGSSPSRGAPTGTQHNIQRAATRALAPRERDALASRVPALALPVTEAVHHDELAVYALESRRAGPLQRMIW